MGKIKFHPLFVLYVFSCIYFGWCNNVFYYVVAVILHEYGHYFMTKKLGYSTNGILFSIYGASLNTNNAYKIKDDIKISLSGPIVNLVLILLSICFWWILPSTYIFTYDFVISNLVIMIFNLIPIYPLDGGRVVVALISSKVRRRKIIKINNIICFLLGVLFLIFFGVSIFYSLNISYLFMGLFLALNSIASDVGEYFERANAFSKNSNTREIKVFKLSNMDKKSMLKCISPNYYSMFLTSIDGQDKIIKEDDLFR